MAFIKSDGTFQGLTIRDGNNTAFIPLHRTGRNFQPLVDLSNQFKKYSTPITGQMDSSGKIWVNFMEKDRPTIDVATEMDSSTGFHTENSMYGTQSSARKNNDFAYISPRTIQVYRDYITGVGAVAEKILITNVDMETNGGKSKWIPQVVSNLTIGWAEREIERSKMFLVENVGIVGKVATETGFTLPTSGIGQRIQQKNYPMTAEGGTALFTDIMAILNYKRKIGRNDGTGTEPTYKFASGISLQNNTRITLSWDSSTKIMLAFQSTNAFRMSGLQTDTTTNKVIGIMGIPVDVEDLPPKRFTDNKFYPVNFLIAQVGENGAYGMRSNFVGSVVVTPHSDGIYQLATVLHLVFAKIGYKAFRPELNFISIDTTAVSDSEVNDLNSAEQQLRAINESSKTNAEFPYPDVAKKLTATDLGITEPAIIASKKLKVEYFVIDKSDKTATIKYLISETTSIVNGNVTFDGEILITKFADAKEESTQLVNQQFNELNVGLQEKVENQEKENKDLKKRLTNLQKAVDKLLISQKEEDKSKTKETNKEHKNNINLNIEKEKPIIDHLEIQKEEDKKG